MFTLRLIRDSAFGLFLLLVFLSPSLQNGPWVWWRVVTLPWFGGETRSLGLLALVPVVLVGLWGVSLIRDWRQKRWQWGKRYLTLPLALYTAFILISLRLTPTSAWWTQLALLAALWLTYFYVLNERPRMGWVWATILVVQGVVAMVQFGMQREVGLYAWGEPIINPVNPGASVFVVNDVVYMRGYGLTFHPNALGALMAVLLLCMATLPFRLKWLPMLIGFGGLVVSFSRSGWLAFVIGFGVWLLHRARQVGWQPILTKAVRASPIVLLLIVIALPYADFATSRFFNLNNVYELRSLYERERDALIALQVSVENPIGVGITNYAVAAQQIDPNAIIVHNGFLLTSAELGWLGFAAVLWFTGAGLLRFHSPYHSVWVAWAIANLFDIVLWATTGLRGAVMVGLLMGLLHEESPAPALEGQTNKGLSPSPVQPTPVLEGQG
jgi:hypothetical protein